MTCIVSEEATWQVEPTGPSSLVLTMMCKRCRIELPGADRILVRNCTWVMLQSNRSSASVSYQHLKPRCMGGAVQATADPTVATPNHYPWGPPRTTTPHGYWYRNCWWGAALSISPSHPSVMDICQCFIFFPRQVTTTQLLRVDVSHSFQSTFFSVYGGVLSVPFNQSNEESLKVPSYIRQFEQCVNSTF